MHILHEVMRVVMDSVSFVGHALNVAVGHLSMDANTKWSDPGSWSWSAVWGWIKRWAP